MWRRCGIIVSRRWKSSTSSEPIFTNDFLRQRLASYLTQTSYVDQLVKISPEFLNYRRASILLPLYCNVQTNQVEVLVLKRSEKFRSYTGMIAFAGGMADATDRNAIHTAQREAEEEIGLKPEFYSILGCLPPVADAYPTLITPVVGLLHSKFVDYQLLLDEAAEAFYLELKTFLFRKNNHQMLDIGDHFVSHHFDLGDNHIWGITAYELLILAAVIYQQIPDFPVFRHDEKLDLENFKPQLCRLFQQILDHAKELV